LLLLVGQMIAFQVEELGAQQPHSFRARFQRRSRPRHVADVGDYLDAVAVAGDDWPACASAGLS